MSEDRFKALVMETIDSHLGLRQTIENVNRLATSIEKCADKYEGVLLKIGAFEGQLNAMPDAHLTKIRAAVLANVKDEHAGLAKRLDEIEKRLPSKDPDIT